MHFLGPKITFGEIVKNLVNYCENTESGRSRQKSQKSDETPTQYRSNAVFRCDQKTQILPYFYPSDDHPQVSPLSRMAHTSTCIYYLIGEVPVLVGAWNAYITGLIQPRGPRTPSAT